MNLPFGNGKSVIVGMIVILLGLLFVACGSDTPDPTVPPATAPAATATQSPAPTTPPTVADVGSAPTGGEVDLVALGEDVFQRSAGGIGCQTCHGEDASGGIAPSIIGRNSAEIIGALGRVDAMAFISITAEEVDAIEAYLISIGPAGITE